MFFMRIKRKDANVVKICEASQVKVKTAGDTTVIQFCAGQNKKCPVQNLSKDTYLLKETGEIKEKKKSESRYQSPKSVRRSIHRLMDLIRCNVTEPEKCKWLTLTYSDVMTDGKQAFLDAKLFLRKLKRHLTKQNLLSSGQKSFKYITIVEPQGENHGNSWHLHIILVFEDVAPFIANDVIVDIWSKGFTDTHAVFEGDGLALYFKAYLSDVEYEDDRVDLEEDNNEPATVEKIVNGESKQFLKGERLKYYPTGMNLYSSSRGMKKPEVEEMSNGEAMERVKDAKLVYRETYAIGNENCGNFIDKRYYKTSKKSITKDKIIDSK